LIKNLQNKVLAFQEIQNSIMVSKKESIIRTAKINLNRDLTEEESNKIIENPNLIQEMIKSKLVYGAHQNLKNSLNDIEERHNDILNLERNVIEIHRMFTDLALLVNLQGEIIDNIESNIKHTKECVFQAEDELILSKRNLSGARKVCFYFKLKIHFKLVNFFKSK